MIQSKTNNPTNRKAAPTMILYHGSNVANRRATYRGAKYDVVIGPVANDNTMPVINEYMAGSIDEQTALVLLKPQKLANQYAFLTAEALEHLDFAEAILL